MVLGNAAAPDSSATVPDSHPRQTTLSTVLGNGSAAMSKSSGSVTGLDFLYQGI
jgi:hypothetical protein